MSRQAKNKERITFHLKFTVEGEHVNENPVVAFLTGMVVNEGATDNGWDATMRLAGVETILGGAEFGFSRHPVKRKAASKAKRSKS